MVLVYFRAIKHGCHNFLKDLAKATGIRQLTQLFQNKFHPAEHFVHGLTFILCVYGIYTSAIVQINRYQASPTVISVERNYRSWNGTLPAVTLCYIEHMDLDKAGQYLKDTWNITVKDEEYFYFLEFLYTVLNASIDNFEDLAGFAKDTRFAQIDLFDVVKFIVRSFDQRIISFDDSTKVNVQLVMTERGICYTVNSPMSDLLRDKNVKLDQVEQPISCQYNRMNCFIKFEIRDSAARVEVHSPFEIAGSNREIIHLDKSEEILASYRVIETVASADLRDLSVSQRKCVFFDEGIFDFPIYSKSLCLSKCRALMALEMCNCVPFFYPFVDGPSCSPDGFGCLLDLNWPLLASHICNCPITCTSQIFSITSIKRNSWRGVSRDQIKTISSFRWDIVQPKVRVQRNILFSFEDLLVSFGGAASFFLGISFWNAQFMLFVILKWIFYILMKINILRFLRKIK